MTVVFALIFLAAIVGVFKPYIEGLNRKHFGIAAAVAFILVGVTAPDPDPKANEKKAAPDPTASPAQKIAAQNAPLSDAAASKWIYSTDKDEMRGTTTKYASLKSENEIDLNFPYGTVSGEVLIRRRPQDGLNIIFSVDKGQILCHGYGDSYVSIKFDDGPINRYKCSGPSDGSSETAFLSSGQAILKSLKGSKKAVVEAEFYQQGRQQFIFDTTGLEWK